MKNIALFSLVMLFVISGCNPVLNQAEPTLTPIPTITNTPTLTPTATRTPLPTISPLVEQLTPGQVVMHPFTENNPYVFYSYFPRSAVREKNIVVGVWPHGGNMFNNDYEYHKDQAKNTISWLKDYSEKYKIPLVVVAIPRVEQLYVHTIHPGTFSTTNEMLSRPDLKLIDAVWNQYIPSIKEAGFVTNDKVLMMGMSSPGIFTHRFAILHPELIQAAWECAEAAAPLPASEMNGTPLDYPLGIRNLETLTGKAFDLETYLKIPQMICVGENDNKENNDPTNSEIFPGWHWQYIKTNFGKTNPERVKFFYDYLVSIGTPAEFRLYKGIGHEITDEMMNDAFQFLVSHSQP